MSDNKEHMQYLEFSCQNIEITAKPGEMTDGSFMIYATDKYANGKIYSSDTRMRLMVSEFRGQQIVVQYCFDGVTVEYGKQIKGEFVILSNYGEYIIPYVIDIQKKHLDSSLGVVKNLFHFANLAQANWTEAVEMFYSDEFKTIFSASESEERLSYLGLSRFQHNERNVEEFLIEVSKKLPVTYSFDIEGFILEDVLDSTSKTITITKSTWGYTELELTTEGKFLILPIDKIIGDDFENNIYSLTFKIDASMLHKGINNGNIIIKDCNKIYKISVDIFMENQPESRTRNKYKKSVLKNMVKAYVDMKFLKKTREQWIDFVSNEIDKLSEYDEGNILVKLYEIQMLIYKERFNEAKWNLDKIEAIMLEENSDITTKGYYLYLTTLFNRDESYIKNVCDEISTLYANNQSKWWLTWFLMHLDDNYVRDDEQKWKLLEQLFKQGCVSPVVLCEAVLLLRNKPTFLLKLGSFEENVLWNAARNEMLNTDLLEQVQYLVARKKDYSSMLYKVLTEAYRLYKSPQTIAAICKLLINGDKKGSEYFKWYALGVEHAVRVTKLYEYYMMSLKIDKFGNIAEGNLEIPKMVLMYFAYQSTLDYEKNAFLYAYVIKNRDKYPDLEQSYRIAIERFVMDQIKAGRINENLAYLYQNVLVPQMIIDETAYAFSALLFMHCVYVNDPYVKNIIVIQEKIKGESSYPVIDNKCMIPIYGSEYKLFLQDDDNNRYTKSSAFEDIQLMKTQKMVSFIDEYMKGRLSFDLYLCEYEKNYIVISSNNLKRYKNLADSPQVTDEFKKEIRTKLLRYYYDNDLIGELDSFLEDIEADEMQIQERAEFVRYLISRGMFSKAYSWIRIYGSSGVNPKSLARLISKTIITKNYEYDEYLVNLSFYIYENMKYDENILYYLLNHYEGKLTNLRKLWKSAVDLELDTEKIICKILRQIKYTGVTIQEKDEILIEYLKYENCDRELVKEMLNSAAHDYFVYDAIILPQIFDEMYEEYCSNHLTDEVAKLALLKYWSEVPEYLGKIPGDIISGIVKEFLEKDIVFPFYKKLSYVVPELHYFMNRTFVEHKTVSGRKVNMHFILEDLCNDLSKEFNADYETLYETIEMKEMFEGIYVGMFMLFSGEAIQYYITEKYINDENFFEEKIEVSDVVFGDNQTEDEYIIGYSNTDNRYMMLNDIMTSIDMKDELTAQQLVQEYLYKDFCTRELFRIL